MSLNEEVIKSIVQDYDKIGNIWSPLAIVYNALKVGSIDGTDVVPHDKAIARAQEADYKANKKVKGRPECTLFVGRLAKITDSVTLKKVFGNYGAIKRCRLVEDIVTGSSKGYAFIEFENEASAAAAYKHSHLMNLDGKQIIVDYECERLLPGWVPRRLGGGFCGRKESGQLRFGCRCKPFIKPIDLLTEEDLIEKSTRGKENPRREDGIAGSRKSPSPRCSSRNERDDSHERGAPHKRRHSERERVYGGREKRSKDVRGSPAPIKKSKRGYSPSSENKRSLGRSKEQGIEKRRYSYENEKQYSDRRYSDREKKRPEKDQKRCSKDDQYSSSIDKRKPPNRDKPQYPNTDSNIDDKQHSAQGGSKSHKREPPDATPDSDLEVKQHPTLDSKSESRDRENDELPSDCWNPTKKKSKKGHNREKKKHKKKKSHHRKKKKRRSSHDDSSNSSDDSTIT